MKQNCDNYIDFHGVLFFMHYCQRPVYKKWPDKEGLVNDEGMPSPTCASLSAVAEGNLVNCLKLCWLLPDISYSSHVIIPMVKLVRKNGIYGNNTIGFQQLAVVHWDRCTQEAMECEHLHRFCTSSNF